MNLKKTLLAVASFALTAMLNAASINYEVQVPGYSGAGWIKVKPELRSQLGGRVAYLPQHGGWVTDRVARGEQLQITYVPSTATERCRGGHWGGLFTFSGGYKEMGSFGQVSLPYRLRVTCPTGTTWDNVHADIQTNLGYFIKRVPIGSRPR
jgi:hypothetical protein